MLKGCLPQGRRRKHKKVHLKVNARIRKNYIQGLQNGHEWAVTHEDKKMIITNHFSTVMATPPTRTTDFNWEQLQVPAANLSSLDAPLTEQEILAAISQLPSDKSARSGRLHRPLLQNLLGNDKTRCHCGLKQLPQPQMCGP
jgi:hypothetical protein